MMGKVTISEISNPKQQQNASRGQDDVTEIKLWVLVLLCDQMRMLSHALYIIGIDHGWLGDCGRSRQQPKPSTWGKILATDYHSIIWQKT